MRVVVRAKTGAKEGRLKIAGKPEIFEIAVKEQPVDGKANKAIIKILAEHFGVSPSRVRIVSGESSRRKVFELF